MPRRAWLVAALALLAGGARGGDPTHLSVDEAVAQALDRNSTVSGARARLEAAEASARSSRGRLLPSLFVSDEAQRWNAPFSVAFALPGLPPGPSPTLTVREATTNTFVAGAGQPIVGLLHLAEDERAGRRAASASETDLSAARAQVREAVETKFLQLFQARALGDIARASQRQLRDQVALAESRVRAGVLTRADVLRAEVAAANAHQQEILAGAEEEMARSSLLVLMGYAPDESRFVFDEPTALESAAPPLPDLTGAVREAMDRRPEVAGAALRVEEADSRAQARVFSLLPEVSLEAAYTHLSGQVLAPIDSSFVGVKADWPFFEWGAGWYAQDAARAQATASRSTADDVRGRVAVEVASRLAQAGAAVHAVETAQAAIASAEEAFRVTQALQKAGSATTTDVLDAEAALTQARLNLVRARYAAAVARVALRRALGG